MKTGMQLTNPQPGLKDLLDVPLGRHLRADRQVGNDDVGLRLLEDADDVGGGTGGFGDDLGDVLAETVVGHAAVDGDAEMRDIGELDRVVGRGVDRLAQVLADLVDIDVEGGGELDVADVIAAEVDVHQTGDELRLRGRRGSSGRPGRGRRRSCRHR